MNPIEKLTFQFERFPGIGPRQARRFVQYLLGSSPSSRNDLAEQIKSLGSFTAQCSQCFRWYAKREQKGDTLKSPGVKALPFCDICSDPNRDKSLLFVVEKDADIENVERSGFKGLYFVLGGTIPLAEEYPEKFVRTRELTARVEYDAVSQTLKELILGLSATTEGDHTRLILQEKLIPMSEKSAFKISSLGRGLSTGSELEYADPDTISEALGNRH